MRLTKQLRDEYLLLWEKMHILREPKIELSLDNLCKNYQLLPIPTPVVYCIHQMECSGRWDCHLHNGDPLSAKTVHVPKGRPTNGTPPFTWRESAEDALSQYKSDFWSLADCLYFFEKYNGWGYRDKGIYSPYLWAGTQHYTSGKYTSDGKYDPNAVSTQIGCAVLLKRFMEEYYRYDVEVDYCDYYLGQKSLDAMNLQQYLIYRTGKQIAIDGWLGQETAGLYKDVFGTTVPTRP